jgi:type II secretion system protein N
VQNNPARGSVLTKILIITVLAVSGLLLFALTAYHIFPLDIAEGRLKEVLARQGLMVSFDSFERTFPFGLKAENLELAEASNGSPVLRLDTAKARLELLSLLKGDPTVALRAAAGGGVITGELRPGLKGALLDLTAGDVEFKEIPVLALAGINTGGSFSGTVSVYLSEGACPSGSVRLRGGHIKEDGVMLMGLKLPIGDIDSTGLNAEFRECKVVVEGLWLDGKEMSAKLSGEIFLRTPFETSPVKMTLEVTPRGDLDEKAWMLSMMNSFRKSANYYSANIGGTIGRPVAER